MTPTAIDKSSRVPYYDQLRSILEHAMSSGRLAIGDRLPSEAQLCEQYGVSRTVVRQALMELANDGRIVRHKGRGSFVAPPKTNEHLAQSLSGLAEEVQARGQRLTNQILQFGEMEAPEGVAEQLEIEVGAPVVHLERLRSIGGEPHVLTSTYLPADLCEPLLRYDMRHRSLYDTLERELGLYPDHGRRTIEAMAMNRRVAELLDANPGDPVLVLKSVASLADGRPLEHFIAWHRADRTRFDVELVRRTVTV